MLTHRLIHPQREHLSIELCITDLNNNHRRFLASTANREVKITALHVTLPLTVVKRGVVCCLKVPFWKMILEDDSLTLLFVFSG